MRIGNYRMRDAECGMRNFGGQEGRADVAELVNLKTLGVISDLIGNRDLTTKARRSRCHSREGGNPYIGSKKPLSWKE